MWNNLINSVKRVPSIFWFWKGCEGGHCKRNYFLSMVRVNVNPEISERVTGAIEQCEPGWACTPWLHVHLGKAKVHLSLRIFPSLFQYGILFQFMLQNKTPVHVKVPRLFIFPVSVYASHPPLFLPRTNCWKKEACIWYFPQIHLERKGMGGGGNSETVEACRQLCLWEEK